MEDREQRVREQATRFWEDEGRPGGIHEEHWRRAERLHDEGEKDNPGEVTENWKVEAGLADEKPAPSIMPTVIPPD